MESQTITRMIKDWPKQVKGRKRMQTCKPRQRFSKLEKTPEKIRLIKKIRI
jgi:hypothetical protein